MLHTALTCKALEIAARAHERQTDRAGVPYIVHPVIVADKNRERVEKYRKARAFLLD